MTISCVPCLTWEARVASSRSGPGRAGAPGAVSHETRIRSKPFATEDYCTNDVLLLIKIMLCSKLPRQKVRNSFPTNWTPPYPGVFAV